MSTVGRRFKKREYGTYGAVQNLLETLDDFIFEFNVAVSPED
jgi:hypothetical protein